MSITKLKHSKKYDAKSRRPMSRMEALMGYVVIKLEENYAYTVYGHPHHAPKGCYLAQCHFPPNCAPVVIDSWAQLRRDFVVFNNTAK